MAGKKSKQAPTMVETPFGKVDVELFRKQKQSLLAVIAGGYHNDYINNHLDGLLSMLDDLQDKVLEPSTDKD